VLKTGRGICAAALALSGCMSDFGSGMMPGDRDGGRHRPHGSATPMPRRRETHPTLEKSPADSQIIQGLRCGSLFCPDVPFDQVAAAVLAANSRTAEQSCAPKRLRVRCGEQDWLPNRATGSTSPRGGSLAGHLVVDQVLFGDNGRRAGERALLVGRRRSRLPCRWAQDTNNRVPLR